jgi:hypothetical protein
VPGRRELPPLSALSYFAFVDPSGGSQDSFTLAVAHGESRGDTWVAVLDCLCEVRPPFSPDAVVRDFAAILKSYNLHGVTGDRYGGEWPRERFAVHGVAYEVSASVKSDLYLAFLPLLNAGRLELLDEPRLRRQLLDLDRRVGRTGRDTVDHAPGGHDDVANVAAGALVLAAEPPGSATPAVAQGEHAFTFRQPPPWDTP